MLAALEQGDEKLPSAEARWRRLLLDRDAGIRLAAERFIFEQTHGRAKPSPEESRSFPVEIRVDVSADSPVAEVVSADPEASTSEPDEGGGRWEIT